MESNVNLLFSIATLILSVIAIGVSIYTVYKQNKLHLFDKRYDVFCILSFLVSVAQQTIEDKGISDQELLLTSRNAYIEAISPIEQKYSNGDLKAFYHNLCLSAIKVTCFFPKKHTKIWRTFIKAFTTYFSDAIDSKDTEATKQELRIILNVIYNDKILNNLEKYLNIRR